MDGGKVETAVFHAQCRARLGRWLVERLHFKPTEILVRKALGFRPEQAKECLGLTVAGENRDRLPRRYVIRAYRAFEYALVSEGRLAKLLRADRVSARQMMATVVAAIDSDAGGQYIPIVCDFAEPLVK